MCVAAKDSTQKIHPHLKEKQEGMVPVIIQYDDSVAPEKKALRELGCKPGKVLKSLHGIAAECPAEILETIADDDDTVYLFEDEMLYPLLDQTVPLINATAVWSSFGNGSGINVSILDTGINTSHPALAGKVVLAENFITEFSGEDLDDYCNHGTPVACTVGCIDSTYKGVAPGVNLFNAKVAFKTDPDRCGAPSSAVIAAIDWSIANGAQVIQLSVGALVAECYQSATALAVNNSGKNIPIIVSAGNDGPGSQSINTPGCAENAITVGASNGNSVEDYSSRGPTDYGLSKPDLVAPGTGITAADSSGAGFSDHTGTSFSSPHVSGVVALMLQQKQLSPDVVKQILKSTAVNLSYDSNTQGAGRVDAFSAVNASAEFEPAVYSVVLQPDAAAGKDTYISSASPNTNYGTADPLKVQTNSFRALIGWNLSSIPANAVISGAIMQLYVPSVQTSTGNTVNAYRLTRQWFENNATWKKYDGTHSWTTAGGDYSSTVWASRSVGAKSKYYSWDITQLVKSWQNSTYQNYGIIMVSQASNNRKDFSSSDASNASRRPALEINYTL